MLVWQTPSLVLYVRPTIPFSQKNAYVCRFVNRLSFMIYKILYISNYIISCLSCNHWAHVSRYVRCEGWQIKTMYDVSMITEILTLIFCCCYIVNCQCISVIHLTISFNVSTRNWQLTNHAKLYQTWMACSVLRIYKRGKLESILSCFNRIFHKDWIIHFSIPCCQPQPWDGWRFAYFMGWQWPYVAGNVPGACAYQYSFNLWKISLMEINIWRFIFKSYKYCSCCIAPGLFFKF